MSDSCNLRPLPLETVVEQREHCAVASIRKRSMSYTAGEGSGDLSTELGISKSGLLRLLRTEGVNLRKQPMTPLDANRAAWLHQSGLTITKLVEKIGYSYSTVRKSLNAGGVAMRPMGIKRSSLGRS